MVPQSLTNIRQKHAVNEREVFDYTSKGGTFKALSGLKITTPEALDEGSEKSKWLNPPQPQTKCLSL